MPSEPPKPKQTKTVACRLYVFLARNSSIAVVFRRGPGNKLLMLKWDRKTDTFEQGQWVKHKIYERRCDLSPNGDYLIYFAAKFKPPLYSWTSVSKVPYFAALALWPKTDAWGGGGTLDDKRVVNLNHRPEDMRADPKLEPHPRWRVIPMGATAGSGEDYPVERERLLRDGWTVVQEGQVKFNMGRKAPAFVTYDPSEILTTGNPKAKSISLRRVRSRALVRQGKHYEDTFEVVKGNVLLRRFENFDWADWDSNGDLLLANNGKIWRLSKAHVAEPSEEPLQYAKELCDLTPLRFKAVAAPGWAKTW